MKPYTSRQIEHWKAELAPYRRAAPSIEPQKSALLVIDMQHHFSPDCDPAVAPIRRAVDHCRLHDILVVFTQHGHTDPKRHGGMLSKWWDPAALITRGTTDHALIPDTGLTAGDPVIDEKQTYDAFQNTRLEGLLRSHGVADLTVCGVMTNLCVETTARAAFVRNFSVRVLLDGTATAAEWMHVGALRNLAFGFAYVQTVSEWIETLPS